MDNKITKEELDSIVENRSKINELMQQIGVLEANKLSDDDQKEYSIFIKKSNEILPWKKFNSNMAVAVEYDLNY